MSKSDQPEFYLSEVHFYNATQTVDNYIPIGISKDRVLEINFYSRLNSLCMSGDITIVDPNNNLLDCINEPDMQCIIEIFRCVHNNNDDITKVGTLLKYAFIVSQIDVINFKSDTSTLKVYLEDTIQNLAMDKLMRYSNFDVKYHDITIEADLKNILTPLEVANGTTLTIPGNVFGESIDNYRRRFTSSRDETVEEAMIHYLENLYEKGYDESILTKDFDKDRKIPDRLVAFAPFFQIEKEGSIIKMMPYLTSAIEVSTNGEVDVPETEFKYAKKKIAGVIEGISDPMNVQVAFSKLNKFRDIKDLSPLNYVTNWMNKKTGNHDYNLWDKQPGESLILSNNFKNIKSDHDDPFPGYGTNPEYEIHPFFRVRSAIEKYAFTTDYRFYGDNSNRSLYQDLSDILIRPFVYVTCPFSAMHSPGQIVDFKFIRAHYESIYKSINHTYNKLFSGKWKVINTMTKFSNNRIQNSVGMAFQETLGLNRLGYFSEENIRPEMLHFGTFLNKGTNINFNSAFMWNNGEMIK